MSRLAAGVLAAAVLAAGGSVYALSNSTEPAPAETTVAEQVPTSEATLACPESPQTKHTSMSLLAVAPRPTADASVDASADPGTLSVSPLGDPSKQLGTASEIGVPVTRSLGVAHGPSVVAEATGRMSAGAAAFQSSVEDGEKHSGRAVAACSAGSDDWWFNGADTSVGSTSRLVLTNTTPAIAVVDVELFGPKGPSLTVGQRGIALAPDSRESLDLARFAPNLDTVTVHVLATEGLVTAAVETTRIDGVTPAGSEWLPPASAPDTDVVIDAAVDGSATQDLQIVNPADVGALVQVQVIEDTGPFVPAGLESVRVAPGSVTTVKLGKISHNDPVSVRLTSSTAVTGAVVSTAKGGADYAVSSPSPLLTGQAVLPVIPDVDLAVTFSGTSQQSTGQYKVAGFDQSGNQVFVDTVNVDGLRTGTWTPPTDDSNKGPKGPNKGRNKKPGDKATAVYLVITPSLDTDVQGIAVYSDKDGVAALPIVPGVFSVTRPSVTPGR
ncbi:MAG TPA: DUF5719 family protein [Nocardioidaceae bacterium]|nr:DUF5719 family protein [Nocardioidaceae bacterium]